MDDAVSDTGPLLHLHEASFLRALGIFTCLCISPLVAEELASYRFELSLLRQVGVALRVEDVVEDSWREAMQAPALPPIQPADAQVLALARQDDFRRPVLTDDLALRRCLEAAGADVVGSVGQGKARPGQLSAQFMERLPIPDTPAGLHSHRVVTTIPLTPGIGMNPVAIAADPHSSLVYVANDGSADVTVLSGTDTLGMVAGLAEAGRMSYSLLGVHPTNGLAYAVEYVRDCLPDAYHYDLQVISATRVITTIPTAGATTR
jgi:hypothetical protein